MQTSRTARTIALSVVTLLLSGLGNFVQAGETVTVGGTGMAIAAMRGIAGQMAAAVPGVSVNVLPSIGTKGGLQALADGVIQVATAGRPLKAAEKAAGLREAACVATPLAFVTSRPATDGVRRADLATIFSDPMARWADGMPLKVILRARSGSEMPYLASQDPALGPAFEAAGKRPGIAVGVTDQENADLARRIEGSFAIMTLLQLRSEDLDLRPVPLDGIVPSAEALAAGTYPYAIRLCIVLPTEPTDGALRLVEQMRSDAGKALFRSLGAEPVE